MLKVWRYALLECCYDAIATIPVTPMRFQITKLCKLAHIPKNAEAESNPIPVSVDTSKPEKAILAMELLGFQPVVGAFRESKKCSSYFLHVTIWILG